MRDDIDNQGAADLAHTEDPLGERTIGVLTKPDTLQRGEERTWMKILEGSSHPLKHGYFMMKQASPEELEKRMSFEDARKSEREWFQTNAPWKDMSNFHNRMGTRNLTKELSRLLGAVINQALPKLCKMSKESLQQVSHDIAALPPPVVKTLKVSFSNAALHIRDSGIIYGENIQKSITRELPFNVPFRAKVALVEQFYADWHRYCQTCFDSIYGATLTELQMLVDHHFTQFNATALLDHMLKLEDPPFTLNDHYFATYRDKYLSRYKEARQPPDFIDGQAVRDALSALAAIGLDGLKDADLARLRGPDPYEEELTVMAETSAYFHVSYKRIIDNIPRIIDHDFLHSIGKKIQDMMIQDLSLGAEDATERAGRYLAEDDQVRAQRQVWLRKKERLTIIQNKLFNFGA
ncbi:unnamed protein product [Somion occarium]